MVSWLNLKMFSTSVQTVIMRRNTTMEIYIPKVDHEYFSRMISNNPNWSCSKYCKIVSNDLLLINGIKIISRGVGDV